MKILHAINNMGGGGAEKLLEELLPLLNKEHDITLLLLTERGSVFGSQLNEMGIEIVAINRSIRNPLNIFSVFKLLKTKDFDVVHAHLFPTFYWIAIASLLTRRRKRPTYIMTEHSTHNKRREIFIARKIEKLIYSRFDKIICISEATKENLARWVSIRKDKFIVINNGINFTRALKAISLPEMKEIRNTCKGSKLVCMVGRFTEQKDQATLIKAIANLPKEYLLLLVGEGNTRNELEKLSIRLGIDNRVHFLGFRRDIFNIMNSVDLIVLSSKWEGFGLAALEGMAVGKPVLGSNVEGLKEVIDDSRLLFKVGDERELGEKIRKILSDKILYQELVNHSLKKSQQYSIENMARKYNSVYMHLKGEKEDNE